METTAARGADLPDITVDLLVVGSGGGGLMAALTAAALEKGACRRKLPTLGGTTAISWRQ